MANLLFSNTRSSLTSQKYARRLVFLTLMTMLGVIFGGLALIPSMFYTQMLHGVFADTATLWEKAELSADRKDLTQELRSARDVMMHAHTIITEPRIDEELTLLFERYDALEEFRITGAEFTRGKEGEGYTLRVSGNAEHRAAVVALQEQLRADSLYVLTSFPLSNFTPSPHVYTVSFTLVRQTL